MKSPTRSFCELHRGAHQFETFLDKVPRSSLDSPIKRGEAHMRKTESTTFALWQNTDDDYPARIGLNDD